MSHPGGVRGPDIENDLREGMARGHPSHALLDAWTAIGGFAARRTSVLAGLLQAAGADAARGASAALVDPDALAFAVLDARGRPKSIGATFATWVGDPADSVDCGALARRAALDGRAIGMARTTGHGVLAVLALGGAAAERWSVLPADLGQRPAATDIVLVVFAPSRSKALALRTAEALGLTPLEARIAAALLVEPSLDSAAHSLGVGRETAKDALAGALRKTGARRAQHLVGRLIDLSCNVPDAEGASGMAPGGALGLSPAERAVAVRLAVGDTADEAAVALGLRPGTVKAYRRSVFGKLGIGRARDLRRLMTEAGELGRLASAEEVALAPVAEAALRIFVDHRGRSVACLDYGPSSGEAVVLMHGYSTGRTAPPPLLKALRARGRRVVVPQRPGFGLTSPAGADYVTTAADDMALVLDGLGCAAAGVLARDGGVACALEFAQRHPGRIRHSVLINPMMPREATREKRGPMSAMVLMLLNHPSLIEPLCAMMARQMGDEVQAGVFRRLLASTAADLACFEQPGVAERLFADIRHLGGRTSQGLVAELSVFARGWRPPDPYAGPRWRLVLSGDSATTAETAMWDGVSHGPPVFLHDAGLLVQFTHAGALADLIDP